jgi:bacteriorhodopsin
MNLAGIATTNKDEGWFWKICGTAAFLIVLVVVMGAFRHRLKSTFSRRRMKYTNVV